MLHGSKLYRLLFRCPSDVMVLTGISLAALVSMSATSLAQPAGAPPTPAGADPARRAQRMVCLEEARKIYGGLKPGETKPALIQQHTRQCMQKSGYSPPR